MRMATRFGWITGVRHRTRCDLRHTWQLLLSHPSDRKYLRMVLEQGNKDKEALMVRQDFLLLVLLVFALYFAQQETGIWKH